MNTPTNRSPAETAAFANARIDAWSIERNAMRMRASHAGGMLRATARLLGSAFAGIAVALRQRRAIAELAQLDDRLLADVGMRREDIVGLVAAGNQRGHSAPPVDDRVGSKSGVAPMRPSQIVPARAATAANHDTAPAADRKVA
ncbi:MAG: DUF1127 domain-containing protein [Azospirillaceae bacterium]